MLSLFFFVSLFEQTVRSIVNQLCPAICLKHFGPTRAVFEIPRLISEQLEKVFTSGETGESVSETKTREAGRQQIFRKGERVKCSRCRVGVTFGRRGQSPDYSFFGLDK